MTIPANPTTIWQSVIDAVYEHCHAADVDEQTTDRDDMARPTYQAVARTYDAMRATVNVVKRRWLADHPVKIPTFAEVMADARTIKQAAIECGTTDAAVRYLVESGQVEAVKINGFLIVPLSKVAAALKTKLSKVG